jgi:hypothetical protein
MNQCRAHSSQTEKRCKKQAIAGGTVCATHGGSAPQVRKAAALRVLELVNPALANLAKDLKSQNPSIRQRATFDVLDRAGLKGTDRLQLFGPEDSPDINLESLTNEQLAALKSVSDAISQKSLSDSEDRS